MAIADLTYTVGRRAQALTLASVRLPSRTMRQLRPWVVVDQAQQFGGRVVNANWGAARDALGVMTTYAVDLVDAATSLGRDIEKDTAAVSEAGRRSSFEEQAELRHTNRDIDRIVTRQVRKRSEDAEQVAADAARQARSEQRRARKRDREASLALYEGHTKADLSAVLADRGLPKTGNRDELIERLVDNDLNG